MKRFITTGLIALISTVLISYAAIAGCPCPAEKKTCPEVKPCPIEKVKPNPCPCQKPSPCPCQTEKATPAPCPAITKPCPVITKETPVNLTVLQTLANQEKFSTFVKLAKSADLAYMLENDNVTVFAPTNTAFNNLDKATLNKLTAPQNKALLKNVLLNHIVAGNYKSEELAKMETITTLEGSKLCISTVDGVMYIDKAKVLTSDICAKNGTVYIIDKVNLP